VRKEQPTGIRKTTKGWQAFVYVRGRFYSKRYPKKTDLKTMKDWRQSKAVEVKAGKVIAAETPKTGDFELDAAAYLASVSSMPSFTDRRLHILEWANYFAGRDRQTITPLEIRTRLERLVSAGYSPSTVNKRRTALMAFYTRMNGKSGYNPVRDVEKYHEDEEPRAQSFWTIYRILALMRPSKTRARLRVLLWTGWPHKQLKQLRPEHLDLAHARAYVTPRRKGKGRKGVWLPLLPGAVTALQDFAKWDCWTPTIEGKLRPFSHSAMHSRFAHALAKLNARRATFGHPPLEVHPYDLRHSFGTMLAERLQDDRAIQELMLHSRPEQTLRYTRAATQGRVLAAVALIGAKPLPRPLPAETPSP
jgi:integrase